MKKKSKSILEQYVQNLKLRTKKVVKQNTNKNIEDYHNFLSWQKQDNNILNVPYEDDRLNRINQVFQLLNDNFFKQRLNKK